MSRDYHGTWQRSGRLVSVEDEQGGTRAVKPDVCCWWELGHILPMGTIPSADETRVSVGCNRDAPRWGGWINYSFVTQI